ncbi:MAG: uroporphyrinogen-III synthase [Actinomycetota bacterium]|nr:uroporphyrinogen-III synthase [Actinomycetota bacterium]
MDGLRVGVTGARKGAELTAALERRGAEVLWGPMLAPDRQAATERLLGETDAVLAAGPDWLVASTGVGMRCWLEVAQQHGRGPRLEAALSAARVVARGAKAVGGLRAAGLKPEFVSPNERDRDLAAWLVPRVRPAQAVAVQLHATASDEPYGALRARGVQLLPVRAYGLDLPRDPRPARRLIAAAASAELDAVICTSPPAAHNLSRLAAQAGLAVELVAATHGPVGVAAIGPRTAEVLEEAGIPVAIMPQRARTGELLRALDAWAARRRQGEVVDATDRSWPIELSPASRVARIGPRAIVLGELEFEVLAALVRRPGVVCPMELLAREAWGHQAPEDPRAVKHQISRVRRKLGPAGAAIATVRGVGYRYTPQRRTPASIDDQCRR